MPALSWIRRWNALGDRPYRRSNSRLNTCTLTPRVLAIPAIPPQIGLGLLRRSAARAGSAHGYCRSKWWRNRTSQSCIRNLGLLRKSNQSTVTLSADGAREAHDRMQVPHVRRSSRTARAEMRSNSLLSHRDSARDSVAVIRAANALTAYANCSRSAL